MPYEYRGMTPEERAAAVEDRRRRGYPLHAPPHPYREAGWYCVGGTTYEHAHILDSPARLTSFEDQLLKGLEGIRAEVAGWVVLSNHYHCLLGLNSLAQIGDIIKGLHGRTARCWNLEDGLTGQRRVWYKYYDRSIRNERHYTHALNYVHYNPVRHGYVDSPYDWPWSSVHRYFDTYGRDWLRRQWAVNPVGDALDYGD